MSSIKNDRSKTLSAAAALDAPRFVVEDESVPRDLVAERAYSKYSARGGEHGHDLEDWMAAQAEIAAERSAVPPTPNADGMHSPSSERGGVHLT